MYTSSDIFIFLEDDTAAARNEDIYDEDEEMAFDAKNEEVSEDDIESDTNDEFDINNEEGEYERMMMEFNESDDDDNDEETSEVDSDGEVIVDQPLNSEQMPHSFGEFASYFKNITESLLFCWMQKHRICKLYSFKTYKR
ncbi:hypothetical protein C1645_734881 [Glomus cerebriforme]|uniref:Uncharacterized protein n=1 Tax=Glomus cerebriforme TaxID=658196 RepID=A0A397TAI5_9GLOM|nr:hypothetical protein C1645_734881 [Glomus cerebriforme]